MRFRLFLAAGLTLIAGCGGDETAFVPPSYATSGVVKSSHVEAKAVNAGEIQAGGTVLVTAYIEPNDPAEAAVTIAYIVAFMDESRTEPVLAGSHALFGEFEPETNRVTIQVEMQAPAYPGTYKLRVSHLDKVTLAETSVVVVK